MGIEAQVVAYEGGKIRTLASGESSNEAVLALPLNRLLVRMVRVPPETDAAEFSLPLLKAMSPFPDDELTVSCETVSEGESGKVVIAAALPESAADDIGEALDAAKLNVVRIDSLAIGALRGVWSSLGEAKMRRLVAINSIDCLTLIVLDEDQPVAIRAVTDVSELKRELMLTLLEAENFGGMRELGEIVVVEFERDEPPAGEENAPQPFALDLEAFKTFAPVSTVTVGRDAALVGVAERAADDSSLNALPESWREVLEETRFKHKLTRNLIVAVGIWVLAMAVLIGVPIGYGFLTDHQKDLSRQHARQYKAVKEMKEKVKLITKYSDHARGALEIMKAVSDRLPADITLSSWYYKRDEGIRVAGDSSDKEQIYQFKEAMDSLVAGEDDEAERIFPVVELGGPSSSRGGYRFDLECQCNAPEEE